jgi:predicted porin
VGKTSKIHKSQLYWALLSIYGDLRMKKSLFAIAAVGALAGVAQAQSSVTVYGIIDMGLIGGTDRATQGGAVNTTAGVMKTTGLGVTSSGESTSRIGFKGSEDLGGGLSAIFTYETAVDPTATTLIATTRQAFVGVKKNGIGALTIGSQNTVIYDAVLASSPNGVNNMGGDLINIGIKGPQGVAGSSLGGSASTYGLSNSAGFNTRVSNSVVFKSDNFSGFTGRLLVTGSNVNSTETNAGGAAAGVGGQKNNSGYGAGLDYTWTKLKLTANFQQFTASSNANATSIAPVLYGVGTDGNTGSTIAAGTNVRDTGVYLAANYDFGILKAFYQYVNRKGTSVSAPLYYTKYTANQVGVNSYVTPAVEVFALAAFGKFQPEGAFSATNTVYTPGTTNLSGFQIGSNYWLSKRTNLYAIYGQMEQSNQSFVAAGTNPYAYNINNYGIGVRHTF